MIFLIHYTITKKPSTASSTANALIKKNYKKVKENSQLFLEKLFQKNQSNFSFPNQSKFFYFY